MLVPQFAKNQFVEAGIFNTAFGSVSGSVARQTYAQWYFGWLNSGNIVIGASGMSMAGSIPFGVGAIFGTGTYVDAHGTTNGQDTDTFSVDFTPLIPASGSVTAYLLASQGTVQQNPYFVSGPLQGHPSYDPNFVPFSAYATVTDTLVLAASTTAADNFTTFEVARTTLTAGMSSLGAIVTTHRLLSNPVMNPGNGIGIGTNGSPQARLGNGLDFDGSGNIQVNTGNGLNFSGGALQAKLGNMLGFDGSNAIAVLGASFQQATNGSNHSVPVTTSGSPPFPYTNLQGSVDFTFPPGAPAYLLFIASTVNVGPLPNGAPTVTDPNYTLVQYAEAITSLFDNTNSGEMLFVGDNGGPLVSTGGVGAGQNVVKYGISPFLGLPGQTINVTHRIALANTGSFPFSSATCKGYLTLAAIPVPG